MNGHGGSSQNESERTNDNSDEHQSILKSSNNQ